MKHLIVFFLLFSGFCTKASTYIIGSIKEYSSVLKKVHRGDSIVWKSGIYKDALLEIATNGIIMCPEKPGTVIFTANSSFVLNADSIVFSGFQFIDGQTDKDIIRVTGNHNLLEELNFSNYHSRYYLNITPEAQYNVISHCNFEKKPEDICSSVVEVQVSGEHPGYHILKYCSFKNHTAPPDQVSDYGIEALRIGYSYQSKFISRTIVEYCYFSKCNGDGEIVSSKARENIYRYNTFTDNGSSHFTLRHGKDNAVYGNFFIGGAGIRVKEGQNQMIYNNYFETGRWFSIFLVNYEIDPLENIVIRNNTFVKSGTMILGGRGKYHPKDVFLANNLFANPTSQLLTDTTGLEQFIGNAVESADTIALPNGFCRISTCLKRNMFGLFQFPNTGTLLPCPKYSGNIEILDIPVLDDDPGITLDIMKQNRSIAQAANQYGCYVFNEGNPIKVYVNEINTGPTYLLHNTK